MGLPSKCNFSYDFAKWNKFSSLISGVHIVWAEKEESSDEQMLAQRVSATESSPEPATESTPEPAPEPMRRRMRMRTGTTRAVSEEIRMGDAPVDAIVLRNVQILRVGPRLRELQNAAVDLARPRLHNALNFQNRATPTEPQTGPLPPTLSDEVLAWVASPEQTERRLPVPRAAPGRGGRRLRNTRRLFISDGRGSGRNYHRTANGTLSRDENEADENEANGLQEGPRPELPQSRSSLSTAELIERLASINESQIEAVRNMEAQMTPWSLNSEGAGPTPTEIYREAYRRLDNSTATGEERRVLQMLVQRGIDGMIREEHQSGLDMGPRGA